MFTSANANAHVKMKMVYRRLAGTTPAKNDWRNQQMNKRKHRHIENYDERDGATEYGERIKAPTEMEWNIEKERESERERII